MEKTECFSCIIICNMETKRLEKENIEEVIKLLNLEEVVVFPTDTVFGAAIRYDSPLAMQRLKEAKQRPENKPFPMMVGNKEQIFQVALVSEKAKKLIDAFMPGAITLVFKKKEEVEDRVTNGFLTIAVRMPDDAWICEVISKVGVPLLVPSANISFAPPCHTSDEVLEQLDGKVAAVVLGESAGSLSSTIVDVTEEAFKILREGPITSEQISAVWEA